MKKIKFINTIAVFLALSTLTSCSIFGNTSTSSTSINAETSSSTNETATTTNEVTTGSTNITTSDSTTSLTTSESDSQTTSQTTSETTSQTTSETTSDSTSQTTNDTSIIEESGYYQVDKLKYTVKDAQDSMGYYSLHTTGTQKLLVVPVQLKGATTWTSTMLSRLDTAFFGTSQETNYWESVSSYYEKSSYGKLNLQGEVIDPIQVDYTTTQLTQYNRSYDIVSSFIVPAFENQVDSSVTKQYDQDKDGYIDATIFVYSNMYDGDAFWAWVWYLQDESASISNPAVGNYMWASYTFMNDSGSDKIDSHTYIHETGHLLGSDDFYSSESYDPVGDLEMQSYNVGDLGAFSKLQFGWSNPYVINGKKDVVELTIRTSALYPDAILINDNWNGSSLDEYILIEYYTPDGNNTLDSTTAYNNSLMYTKSGLRIYHVDARMAKLKAGSYSYSFVSYSDEIKNDGYVYFPAASNLGSDWTYFKNKSDFDKYKLVSLIQSDVSRGVSGARHFKNGGSASNSTLFDLNETFIANSTSFTNGTKFNDGTNIGYSVTLISKTSTTATVRIEKL